MNKKNYLIMGIGCGVLILVAVLMSIVFYKPKYTVKFDSNGGNTIGMQAVKESGNAQVPEEPVRDGYVFEYWMLDGVRYDFNSSLQKNVTLIAKWHNEKEEKYNVTFDTDGGNEIAKQEVEKNNLVEKPENPIKEGYTFEYWTLDHEEYNFNTKTTKDLTLVAKWEKTEKYTVTFNSNGGTAVVSQTVNKDELFKAPKKPAKQGFTFDKWLLDGKAYDFSSKATGNITLVAKWIAIPKYTVTFNSNGGTAVANQTILKYATISKPKNPTKSGYSFVNWTLNGRAYDFSSKVTGNVSLVANWKAVVTKPGIPGLTLGGSGMGGSPIGIGYTIDITGVNGAAGYEIYKSTNSGQYVMFERLNAIVIDTGELISDTTYVGETNSYKVRAYKKDGNAYVYGEFSATKTKVMAALPNPTLEIRGAGGDNQMSGALLGMSTSNPDVENFELYRSTSRDSGYTLLGRVQETDSVSEISVDIPSGITYYYKVRGYVTDGTKTIYSGYSNVVSVTGPNP